MSILVLAANTAYTDFPRLASIVAPDRFLPRRFMNQGDRLAFSNGILILSVLGGVLLVIFGGGAHALIPLMIPTLVVICEITYGHYDQVPSELQPLSGTGAAST